MNNLNVLKYGARPRYYILHPLEFFKETGHILRAAWHRITRGYAYQDIWSMDWWLLEILPPMLRHLEHNHCGSPIDMTDEEWTTWLRETADAIEELQEENWEKKNEYADEFFAICERIRREERNGHDLYITFEEDPRDKELRDKYFARGKELSDEWQQQLEQVSIQICKHYRDIWD